MTSIALSPEIRVKRNVAPAAVGAGRKAVELEGKAARARRGTRDRLGQGKRPLIGRTFDEKIERRPVGRRDIDDDPRASPARA